MMFGKSGSRKSSESAKPPMSPVAKAGTPTKASASSTNRLAVAALGKQLSQLETVGKQLDQTIAWVREHARDSHISLVHDAPKEAAQLSRLRQKLEHAVKELSSLAGSSVSHEAQVVKEEEPKPKSGEGAVVPPRRGTQERELEETREERAANDGGTVIGSVSKILSDESAALSNARTKANDEHKRLTTQMKEIHDLEARNQDLRAEMARKDLRAIREEVKTLVTKAGEVAEAEAELARLTALAERLPKLLSDVETLRGDGKVEQRVQAAEEELRRLRENETRCSALSAEILRLGPKVAAVEKLQVKADQMNAEASKAESLQARISSLQPIAEQLPALRTRLNALQSSAAETKRIQQILKDSAQQEEFMFRLQQQEEELRTRSTGIDELRSKVKDMKTQAAEYEQLEGRLSSLMNVVQRLPMVKAQVESLQSKAREVEDFEAEERRALRADLEAKLATGDVVIRRRDPSGVSTTGGGGENYNPGYNGVQGPGYYNALFFSPSFSRGSSRDGASSVAAQSTGGLKPEQSGLPYSYFRSTSNLPQDGNGAEGRPLNLIIQIVEPPPPLSLHINVSESGPPISLQINVVEPPPPLLPPGVTAQLLRRQQEVEAMQAAHKEMMELEQLRDKLKSQVDVMAASPLATEVQRLRAQVLSMQSLDVRDLEREIEEMATVSTRLEELRARHVRLEAEADEAFILASQLPELEEAASRVMVLRRRKEELECQKAEADSLEGELALMALSIERTGVMKKQLEEMEAQKAELDSIERALGEQAVVELRLARAKMDLTNVHHNVHSIQRIQHEILEIRDRITGNSLVVSHQEDAAAGSEILDVGVALTEIDKDAEEEAMQQVKERLERERGRRNALLAQQKELERLSRESEALVVDNEVLKAQCASAIAMFSSSDKDSASTSDPSRPSEDEAVAKAEEAGPIAAVFSRVRKLEGDKAALKAQVSELTSEVEKLRQGLSASVKRLEEYRNLAATVSSMRKNRTGMGQ